ncbi:MurR/RpiR family transcriptional regulator [Enterococcus eurekensis]|uniref:MurR/RpiR family transcriptional regulator n=1 Tax=Enterococcus eurekensis TaxID=1159753 RepID=A0ABV9M6E2_9ENTE
MSFFGKIDFNTLSDTDRAIYHYLSSNSDKVPYMRVREIATESHTSSSSVMRFIRKIGYESFSDFRKEFRGDDSIVTGQYSLSFPTLTPEQFTRNLQDKLQIIAEKIIECDNVILFGIGNSGYVCDYIARRLAILGCNAFAMTDATYPISTKLKNTADNMVIPVSVSGMTTEILEIVSGLTKEEDMTIVAVTSDASSSLSNMADYVLDYRVERYRINHHDDLTSQIPCIFLLESLTNIVASLER